MRNTCLILLLLFNTAPVFAQRQVRGIVADSITRQVLPFATVRAEGQRNSIITGINGQFLLSVPANTRHLIVSYISYDSRTVSLRSLADGDTLFLSPSVSMLGEVIVKPQNDKIRRILNAAVRNKPSHNPELYDRYRCNVYYKMKVDLLRSPDTATAHRTPQQSKKSKKDSTVADGTGFTRPSTHLIFSETYSRRIYKRPQQLQETIIASRFSGLKKTYFTNLITDVLPFHVNSDYIMLNGKDYINPVSKGWQQRYTFFLADEINDGSDTTFILSFSPRKNAGFNSLSGLIYINSDGYAISHMIASTADTSSGREIRIEQVFSRVEGKWFPSELNYDVVYNQYFSPLLKMQMNGHSVIDSVSFAGGREFRFDKAYPVVLGDSVDLYNEESWQHLRRDTITQKEKNTYVFMDSLFKVHKVENLVASAGKIALGRLPVGPVEIDLARLLATNQYEDLRLGVGLYTGDKISTHYSLGGWIGYGFKDKRIKYGFSAKLYPKNNKDNWFRLAYSDDYQNAGNVHIHPEIDRNGYRSWLLSLPDRNREYSFTAHTQRGYWEIEARGIKAKIDSYYDNNFIFQGKQYSRFEVKEAILGLRYAYAEKRVPLFGYYFPVSTKYPIFYFRFGYGVAHSGEYSVQYARALAAIKFKKHINRWGDDNYRLETGIIQSFDDKPLSRSFLLAAKGFRRRDLNYYAEGGFLTMRPFDYYSSNYFSFLYKHDFDKFLWQKKNSRPFISLAHNLLYGGLGKETKMANADLVAPAHGYHESGIILNHILQKNFFHTNYLYLNTGIFYHWTSGFDWKKNGVWLIGVSTGF